MLYLLGWETVLHYGSLIGAYSLLTLLPELRLGIFTSYNGAIQGDPYTINLLLHAHLIDLSIGVQPAVDNTSHWCSFSGIVSQARRPTTDETIDWSLRYPISAYVGVYWHAVLGKFEVWDDGKGTMIARYGSVVMRLRPLQSAMEFIGVPTDPAWQMLILHVYIQFAAPDSDRRCQHVNVDVLELTTFGRRDDGNGVAASSLRRHATTSSIRASAALVVGITILLLYH